jgi:hypothetical protein
MKLWLVVALLGCSSKSSEPPAAPPPPPADASVDGITSIGQYDPSSGMHLDEDVPKRSGVKPPPGPPRPSRPIDITLRSTPSEAQAAVDGEIIGYTPTYWAGQADGREHVFTFVKSGYAGVAYRFVPIASGVVHAHLDPMAEEPDAGVTVPIDAAAAVADAAVIEVAPVDASALTD